MLYPTPTLCPRPQEDGTAFGAAVKKELTSALKAKAEGSALALADAARDAEAFRRCARPRPRPCAHACQNGRPGAPGLDGRRRRPRGRPACACFCAGLAAAAPDSATAPHAPPCAPRPYCQAWNRDARVVGSPPAAAARRKKPATAGLTDRPRASGGWSMSRRCGSERAARPGAPAAADPRRSRMLQATRQRLAA